MKLHHIALACAALASGSAFAAPAVNPAAADTLKIYLSGATALRAVVAGIVLNDICGTTSNATTTLYNVTTNGTAFSFGPQNNWAISCITTAAFGSVPSGSKLIVYKSDQGGSAQGVFPVALENARPFVNASDLANCTATTPDRVYTNCTSQQTAVPQFGISDVEPALFQGVNVPNDPLDPAVATYPGGGLSAAQLAALDIKPVVQTIFGVAVNNALYNAMFANQGISGRRDAAGAACTNASTDQNCVPTIGYSQARTVFSGTFDNWSLLVGTADAKRNSQVNICRRVQGSGTQAAANLVLGNVPCSASALPPKDWAVSTSAAPDEMSPFLNTTVGGSTINRYLNDNMGNGWTDSDGDGALDAPGTDAYGATMPSNAVFVFEGPGSGDVVSCLRMAEYTGGYAIGHVSRENTGAAALATGWRHVKLEGASPLRDEAKAGRYDYVVESTIQRLKAPSVPLSAQQAAFITAFTTEIAKPAALTKLSSGNQNGVTALPTSYAGNFGTGTAAEITFGSRVTRDGDSCQPLRAVK